MILEVRDAATDAYAAKTIPVEVFSVPSPNFSYDINVHEVSFNNSSSNSLTYLWDFGDGNTSTEFAPVHEYVSAGVYEVTLAATNQCSTRVRTTKRF